MSKSAKKYGAAGEISYGPEISWDQFRHCYEVLQDGAKETVGRVLQIVETLGLPDKQEDAAKTLIKGVIWDIEQMMDRRIRNCVPEDQIPRVGGTGPSSN